MAGKHTRESAVWLVARATPVPLVGRVGTLGVRCPYQPRSLSAAAPDHAYVGRYRSGGRPYRRNVGVQLRQQQHRERSSGVGGCQRRVGGRPAQVDAVRESAAGLPGLEDHRAVHGKGGEGQRGEFTQAGPTGGGVNAPYMLDRIQQGVANKVGAIVTFPLSADTFDPAFKRARDAGVKVVTVEGSGNTQNQDINAGTSFAQFGALAAKTVAAKGGQQNVGFLIDIKTGPAKTYVDAFTEAAKSYPNVQIVDTRYDNGDSTKDIDLATAMITAKPELNHIVTNLGAATPGIIAAIKQKDVVGKVFLTTNSIYSGSVEGMKAGIVYSFLLQDMCAIGTTPVKALVDLAAGKQVAKDIPTRIEFATAATVDQLTADGTLQ